MNLLRILFSALIPPLGVFLTVGLGGAFWLNVLLTLLGYVPGLIHAIWIIAKK
ncbi:MAG: YqaE/Pmp3 family membrane protein [Planctomycetes bacterium]|nr:YqaE/Pmp3 family membrane protein [Planctomycetota bacterium]